MKNYCLILALLIATSGFSQNANLEDLRAVKVYSLLSVQLYDGLFTDGRSYVDALVRPTVSYLWTNDRKNTHEIELNRLHLIKSPMGTASIIDAALALRYEYSINFRKKREAKLIPAIGFGAAPYFQALSSQPRSSTSYPYKSGRAGLQTFIVPRLNWHLNDKLFLDFNVPFLIAEGAFNTSKMDNPAVQIESRRQSDFDLTFLPGYFTARFGVGLKL